MTPEPDAAATTTVSHRLHPTSLFFSFLGHAKGLLIPAVLVLFFARGSSWELWFGLFIIPVMIFEAYRYLSVRFRLTPNDMVITEGVIFRNERHVPLGRIQNIDLTQSFLERIARVAEVRIETASGSEPEAVFKVLSLAVVEEMKAHIFDASGSLPPATAGELVDGGGEVAPEPEPLVELSPRDLLFMGLSPGRGIALVFVIAGLAWQFDLLEGPELFGWVSHWFEGSSPWAAIISGVAFTLGLFVAVMVLAAAWTFQRFHGFRLERHGEDFRLHFGLLTRHSATIPRSRIQFVTVHESWLHRKLDRVAVKIETAGGAGGEDQPDEVPVSRQWFAPLIERSKLPRLLREIHPDIDFEEADWRPLAPGAGRRMAKAALLVTLGPTAGAFVLLRPWGALAFFVLLPLALSLVRRDVSFTRWARPAYGMLYRSGAVNRKWSCALIEKVQVIGVTAGPFDRRHDMATLNIDTAGAGPSGHRMHIHYLENDVARTLRADLAAAVGASEFEWAANAREPHRSSITS